MLSAQEAKIRLIQGNRSYIKSKTAQGDMSPSLRVKTAIHTVDIEEIIRLRACQA